MLITRTGPSVTHVDEGGDVVVEDVHGDVLETVGVGKLQGHGQSQCAEVELARRPRFRFGRWRQGLKFVLSLIRKALKISYNTLN